MRKRIISTIIAVALSVSFIPTSFSEGEDTVINNNGFVINAKDYSDSESSETIKYEINDDDENTEETIHDIESITKNIETDNSIVDTLTSSTTYSDICGRWEGLLHRNFIR